jgi:hypothetical protein
MKSLILIRFDKLAINLFSRVASTALLVLMASAGAAVAQTYDFTFTGSGGMDASGTIDIVGGVAVSGSINLTGVPLEANPSTLITASGSLLPASGATDARNHDGDVITYDNVVNLSNDPIFDGDGLGFGSGYYGMDGGTSEYVTIINLWGNGPGSYSLFIGEAQVDGDGNVIGDPQWVYHTDNSSTSSLNLVPVPEPATLGLVSAGLLSLLAFRRRKA